MQKLAQENPQVRYPFEKNSKGTDDKRILFKWVHNTVMTLKQAESYNSSYLF
jgi:hypothetical protein